MYLKQLYWDVIQSKHNCHHTILYVLAYSPQYTLDNIHNINHLCFKFRRQFFSAAFNLFTPIKIDSKTTVTDKLEVARLAIQIAKEGGFEKVTWDGAEDGKVPSDPITETLGMCVLKAVCISK